MFAWIEDNKKINDVFDNMEHLLICGAIMYGCKFMLNLPTQYAFQKWINIAYAVIFFLGSLFLLVVNAKHAINVIYPNYNQEHLSKSRWIFAMVLIGYVFLAFEFILSVVSK